MRKYWKFSVRLLFRTYWVMFPCTAEFGFFSIRKTLGMVRSTRNSDLLAYHLFLLHKGKKINTNPCIYIALSSNSYRFSIAYSKFCSSYRTNPFDEKRWALRGIWNIYSNKRKDTCSFLTTPQYPRIFICFIITFRSILINRYIMQSKIKVLDILRCNAIIISFVIFKYFVSNRW